MLFGAIAYGQNTFKDEIRANGGLRVGGATFAEIDSITKQAGKLRIMSGAVLQTIAGHVLESDTATMLAPYVISAQNYDIRFDKTTSGVAAMHGEDAVFIEIPIANMEELGTITGSTYGISQLELPLALKDTINNIYYVSNDGDDNSDGLTPSTSFEHHPWMITWGGPVTLAAGDIVCMKRGDTWTIASPVADYITVEESGTAGNYIITTAYGAGAKPIINISTDSNYKVINGTGKSYIIFNNLDISHYAATRDDANGQHGILLGDDGAGDVSHDWVITNCDIHNIPATGIHCGAGGDSYNIVIGDTSATTTATTTKYSNNIYDCGLSGISITGCAPVTLVTNTYVNYNYIHDINVDGTVGQNTYGISFSTVTSTANGVSDGCYIRFNRIENIPVWTGIDFHNGKNAYVQDNYIYNCHSGIVGQSRDDDGTTETLEYFYVERNIIENPTDDIFNDFLFLTISGSAAYDLNNFEINDNTFFYTAVPTVETSAFAIKAQYTNGLIIDGNYFYNGPPAASNGAIMLQNEIKAVTITNNFIHNWTDAIYFTDPDDIDGDITITNNVVKNKGTSVLTNGAAGTINGDINIYNNTFLASDDLGLTSIISFNASTLAAGKTINVKNNIIGLTTALDVWYVTTPTTITGTFNCDYNIYWNSNGANVFKSAGSSVSYANWLVAGYDAHSPNVAHGDQSFDPLLKNAGASYLLLTDFDLQTTSPCINAGVDVAIDYLGTAPDIGYIEKR